MSLYGTADSVLWSRQILINLATSDVLFRPPMGCKVIPVVDTPSHPKTLIKTASKLGITIRSRSIYRAQLMNKTGETCHLNNTGKSRLCTLFQLDTEIT